MTGVIISALVIAAGAIYYDNNRLITSKYKISSQKLKGAFKGFKILQLSDLHSKSFGRDNDKLLQLIDKEKPDVIVLTGDMINSRQCEFSTFINLAKKLGASYETYFVEGNNETILDPNLRDNLITALKKSNIKVLLNEKAEIYRGGEKINIYGLWFDIAYYKKLHSGYNKDTYFSKEDMEQALGKCNKEEFNLLLAHNPLYFDSYEQWGSDLILSGHIHGGLIRLPGGRGLLSPERKFFPQYSEGRYIKNQSSLIVNRGLGGKMLIPRVFNCPEVTTIEFE